MRIVTWNINGLRAVCKRGIGDIATLLDSIYAGRCCVFRSATVVLDCRPGLSPSVQPCHADIICFQETKLTKAELDRDLALVEGW